MRYRVDAIFNSDMDEEDFAAWIEDVLYAAWVEDTALSPPKASASVVDLSAYEVCHMPGWGYSD